MESRVWYVAGMIVRLPTDWYLVASQRYAPHMRHNIDLTTPVPSCTIITYANMVANIILLVATSSEMTHFYTLNE